MLSTFRFNLTLTLLTLCLLQAKAAHAELVAYWTFDETTGTTAQDWSGNVENLDLAGTFAFDPDSGWDATGGKFGGAVHLDAGDYMVQPSIVRPTQAFTYSVWLKPDVDYGAGSSRVDLLYGRSANGTQDRPDIILGHGGAGKANAFYRTVSSGEGVVRSTTTSWSASDWHHMAFTYDGSDLRLYVNGTEESSLSRLGGHQPSHGLNVGGLPAGNTSFDGRLDEIAIWDRALSAAEINDLISGARRPLDEATGSWVFERDVFDQAEATGPGAVGPWFKGGRWRYKTNASDASHNYSQADISEFPDLEYFNSSSSDWQIGSGTTTDDRYPSVRVTDNPNMVPGISDGTKDVVVAWEADFDNFVDIEYRAWNGQSIGYQMLQWDASSGQMRVLQQRLTDNSPVESGTLLASTRIEQGDQILFVLDGNGSGNYDRVNFSESIKLGPGPEVGDTWDFVAERFDDTGLADAAGPWKNSARWRYMVADAAGDYSISDRSQLYDMPDFNGSEWHDDDIGTYPQLRFFDGTMVPGNGELGVAVAWEADFAGHVQYAFQPELVPGYGASVNYQLLHWSAANDTISQLSARAELGADEPAVLGQIGVGIGDLLIFVYDNRTGSMNADRIALDAVITAVPEPAGLGLLLMAGIGLLFPRRRRTTPSGISPSGR